MVVPTDERGLLASSGWGPEMLLDSLQCPGQPLQQRIIWPQILTVLSLRKPGYGFAGTGREVKSERKVITIIRDDYNVVTGAFRCGPDSKWYLSSIGQGKRGNGIVHWG